MTPLRAHIAAALSPVAPEADLGTVDPRAPLRPQLDLDSMDFLRLLAGLKQRLGIDIPEGDYGKVATLDALEAYLTARGAGLGAQSEGADGAHP